MPQRTVLGRGRVSLLHKVPAWLDLCAGLLQRFHVHPYVGHSLCLSLARFSHFTHTGHLPCQGINRVHSPLMQHSRHKAVSRDKLPGSFHSLDCLPPPPHTHTQICAACLPGTFAASSGSPRCLPCALGFYAPNSNSTSCSGVHLHYQQLLSFTCPPNVERAYPCSLGC